MLNFSISNSKHLCCLLTSISTIRVHLFSLKTKIQSYIHFLVLRIFSFRYQKTKTSLKTKKYRHFCLVFSLYLCFFKKIRSLRAIHLLLPPIHQESLAIGYQLYLNNLILQHNCCCCFVLLHYYYMTTTVKKNTLCGHSEV